MPDRDDRWWLEGDEEPEPDWAEQIRAGRKARSARLRDVFATFDDDDPPAPPADRSTRSRPSAPVPAQESFPGDEPYDHEREGSP